MKEINTWVKDIIKQNVYSKRKKLIEEKDFAEIRKEARLNQKAKGPETESPEAKSSEAENPEVEKPKSEKAEVEGLKTTEPRLKAERLEVENSAVTKKEAGPKPK